MNKIYAPIIIERKSESHLFTNSQKLFLVSFKEMIESPHQIEVVNFVYANINSRYRFVSKLNKDIISTQYQDCYIKTKESNLQFIKRFSTDIPEYVTISFEKKIVICNFKKYKNKLKRKIKQSVKEFNTN